MAKEKENDKPEEDIKKKYKPPGFFQFVFNKITTRKEEKKIEEKKIFGNALQRLESVIEEYQETREKYKKNISTYELISLSSKLSGDFFILLLSSCLIASFGLLQNSAAVIIGAMLIAPLMIPILGFALGSIWGDKKLLGSSALTLFTGILSAIVLSAAIGFLIPGIENNEQIMARTNPSIYDIIIALASGFVGSYAFVNPRVSSSLSGVAIAVALVPPLAVTGISIGTYEWHSAFGSFMLFASNLVSISLAASFVFWIMKVHPTQDEEGVNIRAKRKFLISTIVLVIISIPLLYFMKETLYVKRQTVQIEKTIQADFPSEQVSVKVNKYLDKYKITCNIISSETTSDEIKLKIKSDIEALFSLPADVKLIILKAM